LGEYRLLRTFELVAPENASPQRNIANASPPRVPLVLTTTERTSRLSETVVARAEAAEQTRVGFRVQSVLPSDQLTGERYILPGAIQSNSSHLTIGAVAQASIRRPLPFSSHPAVLTRVGSRDSCVGEPVADRLEKHDPSPDLRHTVGIAEPDHFGSVTVAPHLGSLVVTEPASHPLVMTYSTMPLTNSRPYCACFVIHS